MGGVAGVQVWAGFFDQERQVVVPEVVGADAVAGAIGGVLAVHEEFDVPIQEVQVGVEERRQAVDRSSAGT